MRIPLTQPFPSVFLAIKYAYDVLSDPVKRQGYDSTVLEFDDAIPSPRSQLLQSNLYRDADFYRTFGPVFLRNLRFDARLRPDLAASSSSSNNNSSRTAGNSKSAPPPELGDDDTSLEQVHAFYDYWTRFSSWRDFSTQAMEELQMSPDEMENVETRFEKRYLQKEIDKRTKQLKRQEVVRIQTLVERAMEADPRLYVSFEGWYVLFFECLSSYARVVLRRRRERQEQILAKERKMEEKRLEQERLEEQRRAQEQQQLLEEEQLKLARAQEKLQRETQKKLMRKAKQILRRNLSFLYEQNPSSHWKDSYDMNQDIDFLCSTVSVEVVNQFNEQHDSGNNNGADYLSFLFQEIKKRKDNPSSSTTTATTSKSSMKMESDAQELADRRTWSATDLSALSKALKKYPAGGAGRWEAICAFVNHSTGASPPWTKDECIEKYNATVRSRPPPPGTQVGIPATNSAAPRPAVVTPTTEATAEDVWTTEQDQLLQEALAKFPASMDKNERWTAIASSVPGKNKKSCVQRFKAIRELLLQQQPSK
jgi:DnaJ homolog subfamily C member 2